MVTQIDNPNLLKSPFALLRFNFYMDSNFFCPVFTKINVDGIDASPFSVWALKTLEKYIKYFLCRNKYPNRYIN